MTRVEQRDAAAADLSLARAAFEMRPDSTGAYVHLLERENRHLRLDRDIHRAEVQQLRILLRRVRR